MLIDAEKNILAERFCRITSMNEQAKAGSPAAAVALSEHRNTFVSTLRESLGLDVTSSLILTCLATASLADPISRKELEDCGLGQTNSDSCIDEGIADLNKVLPEAGLKVRFVGDIKTRERKWYLGLHLGRILTDEELKVLNLLAAGFSRKEIARGINYTEHALSNRLSPLYKKIGVQGELCAALSLVDDGLFDAQHLLKRISLEKFQDLRNVTQLNILEAMAARFGEINYQIARYLGISPNTVKNCLNGINMVLGTTGIMNRVGLVVSYRLYKEALAEGKIDPKPVEEDVCGLKENQMEILRLAALGLSNKRIAAELGRKESTIKNYFAEVYKILGVNSRLEAVVVSVKTGIINLEELV